MLRLTDGRGADVVYDGSGPSAFQGSLDSLRPSGAFCWHGPVLGGPGPLAQAAQAHRDLEGRGTTGKLLLEP